MSGPMPRSAVRRTAHSHARCTTGPPIVARGMPLVAPKRLTS